MRPCKRDLSWGQAAQGSSLSFSSFSTVGHCRSPGGAKLHRCASSSADVASRPWWSQLDRLPCLCRRWAIERHGFSFPTMHRCTALPRTPCATATSLTACCSRVQQVAARAQSASTTGLISSSRERGTAPVAEQSVCFRSSHRGWSYEHVCMTRGRLAMGQVRIPGELAASGR